MPPSSAARMMRMASGSERSGFPICDPPKPRIDTASPVRPSRRRGIGSRALIGWIASNYGAPAGEPCARKVREELLLRLQIRFSGNYRARGSWQTALSVGCEMPRRVALHPLQQRVAINHDSCPGIVEIPQLAKLGHVVGDDLARAPHELRKHLVGKGRQLHRAVFPDCSKPRSQPEERPRDAQVNSIDRQALHPPGEF